MSTPRRCPNCTSRTTRVDSSLGLTFCDQCGTVLEENSLSSEITFGETAGGAAMVQGSFVSADATRARMNVPYGNRSSGESREQALQNGKKRIRQLAQGMKIREGIIDEAGRVYQLAFNAGFNKGRKSGYVVAACLYAACRLQKTTHMLIDFSDMMQVNVFILGSTFLSLTTTLKLKLPILDPSIFISRFAALLEFKDETQQVAADATRLAQRFSRDWMQTGRRPAGVCGACLFLAAKMNNFRRSFAEIIQVVKIADSTLRKRLEEFKATDSSNLSIEEFRTTWLAEHSTPPVVAQTEKLKKKNLLLAEKKLKASRRGAEGADGAGGATDEDELGEEGDGVNGAADGDGGGGAGAAGRANAVGGPSRSQPFEAVLAPPSRKGKERALISRSPSLLAMSRQSSFAGGDGDDDATSAASPGGVLADVFKVAADFDALEAEASAAAAASDDDAEFDASRSGVRPRLRRQSSSLGVTGGDHGSDEVEQQGQEDGVSGGALAVSTTSSRQPSPSSPSSTTSSATTSTTTSRMLRHDPLKTYKKPVKPAPKLALEDRPLAESHPADVAVDSHLESEIASALSSTEGASASAEVLSQAKARDDEMIANRQKQWDEEGNPFDGLDEDELDGYLLSCQEADIKTRLWAQFNQDYLQKMAQRLQEGQGEHSTGPLPKKKRKRKDSSEPGSGSTRATTPGEAARNMIAAKKFSKKINYKALDTLFETDDVPVRMRSVAASESRGPSVVADEKEDDAAEGFGAGGGGWATDRVSDEKDDGGDMEIVSEDDESGSVPPVKRPRFAALEDGDMSAVSSARAGSSGPSRTIEELSQRLERIDDEEDDEDDAMAAGEEDEYDEY